MRRVSWIAAALFVAGGPVLFWLGRHGGRDAALLVLWGGLQVTAAAAAHLEPPRRPSPSFHTYRKMALLAVCLDLLAALTVGWKLTSVPRNVHNDVGSMVEAARESEIIRRRFGIGFEKDQTLEEVGRQFLLLHVKG